MPTAYLLGLLAPFFWLQAAQPSGMATTVMHINIESMRNKTNLSCQNYHKPNFRVVFPESDPSILHAIVQKFK